MISRLLVIGCACGVAAVPGGAPAAHSALAPEAKVPSLTVAAAKRAIFKHERSTGAVGVKRLPDPPMPGSTWASKTPPPVVMSFLRCKGVSAAKVTCVVRYRHKIVKVWTSARKFHRVGWQYDMRFAATRKANGKVRVKLGSQVGMGHDILPKA